MDEDDQTPPPQEVVEKEKKKKKKKKSTATSDAAAADAERKKSKKKKKKKKDTDSEASAGSTSEADEKKKERKKDTDSETSASEADEKKSKKIKRSASKSATESDESKKKKNSAAASDPVDEGALPRACWREDVERVRELLSDPRYRERVNARDVRGNAPLHIAAHFANMDIVNALLDAGADPELLSAAGWRPLEEAIATGSMEAATVLMKAGHMKYRNDMLSKGAMWREKLSQMDDFYLELHWDFSVLGGWVPLVSSYIPNDTYKIWKRGSSIRLDYSLTGFKNMQISRGNVSFVFTGDDQDPPGHLFVLDHDKKTKQDFCQEPGDHYSEDVKSALDYLFAHDICSHLPLSVDDEDHKVEFRPRTGWFSSSITKEKVHGYTTSVYDTHGMQIRTLIRSDPDAKQTRIPRSFQPDDTVAAHKQPDVEEQYFDPEQEHPFTETGKDDGLVWNTENVKRKIKKFEGALYMCDDYPFSLQDFITLIDIYSPTSQGLKMLQEFITVEMPPGFPVKIELPVFYVLTAVVQFQNLEYKSPDAELFEIPESYSLVNEAYMGNEAREMMKSVESKGSSTS